MMTKTKRTTGATKARQFRLSDESMSDLDFLRARLALESRSAVIRLALRRLANEERQRQK